MAESLPQPPLLDPSLAPAEVKLSLTIIRDFSAISLRQWYAAFENFQRDKKGFTNAERTVLILMKLHFVQLSLGLTVQYGAAGDEMVWDDHLSKFEDLIRYAEEFLQSLATDTQKPVLTLDNEVVLPLFFVAAKCRESKLRWKAIELLRSTNRQEGIWHSQSTADILERGVRIEEDGLTDGATISASSIPRHQRIIGLEVTFDSFRKRANLRYIKRTIHGGREIINEWVEENYTSLLRFPAISGLWSLKPDMSRSEGGHIQTHQAENGLRENIVESFEDR